MILLTEKIIPSKILGEMENKILFSIKEEYDEGSYDESYFFEPGDEDRDRFDKECNKIVEKIVKETLSKNKIGFYKINSYNEKVKWEQPALYIEHDEDNAVYYNSSNYKTIAFRHNNEEFAVEFNKFCKLTSVGPWLGLGWDDEDDITVVSMDDTYFYTEKFPEYEKHIQNKNLTLQNIRSTKI